MMDCTRRGCMSFEEVVIVNLTKSTNSTRAQTQWRSDKAWLGSDKNFTPRWKCLQSVTPVILLISLANWAACIFLFVLADRKRMGGLAGFKRTNIRKLEFSHQTKEQIQLLKEIQIHRRFFQADKYRTSWIFPPGRRTKFDLSKCQFFP